MPNKIKCKISTPTKLKNKLMDSIVKKLILSMPLIVRNNIKCLWNGLKTKQKIKKLILLPQHLMLKRKWWILKVQLKKSWISSQIHVFMTKTMMSCLRKSTFEILNHYKIILWLWYLFFSYFSRFYLYFHKVSCFLDDYHQELILVEKCLFL